MPYAIYLEQDAIGVVVFQDVGEVPIQDVLDEQLRSPGFEPWLDWARLD